MCKRIRQASDVPMIVLSAKSGEHDKVSALEQGADDYVVSRSTPTSCSRACAWRCAASRASTTRGNSIAGRS